jgi:hypothetical protein
MRGLSEARKKGKGDMMGKKKACSTNGNFFFCWARKKAFKDSLSSSPTNEGACLKPGKKGKGDT